MALVKLESFHQQRFQRTRWSLFIVWSPGPVTVENAAAPVCKAPAATAAATAAPAPAKKVEPVLNDTEEYFNNAIKQAVKRGDNR